MGIPRMAAMPRWRGALNKGYCRSLRSPSANGSAYGDGPILAIPGLRPDRLGGVQRGLRPVVAGSSVADAEPDVRMEPIGRDYTAVTVGVVPGIGLSRRGGGPDGEAMGRAGRNHDGVRGLRLVEALQFHSKRGSVAIGRDDDRAVVYLLSGHAS